MTHSWSVALGFDDGERSLRRRGRKQVRAADISVCLRCVQHLPTYPFCRFAACLYCFPALSHICVHCHHESSNFSSDLETSWITWFCRLKGNEFFCEVDENWIQDDFNLCNISQHVPYYDDALDMILDVESTRLRTMTDEQTELIESAAELLYGFIHARYILTSRGLQAMYAKFKNADFGRCPRVMCRGQPVLPVGQSDVVRATTVNVFCPKCKDIYFPRSGRQGNIDGAYFGTTFCHLFLMQFSDLIPAPPEREYEPRCYGFRIAAQSPYYGGAASAAGSRKPAPSSMRVNARAPEQSPANRPHAMPSTVAPAPAPTRTCSPAPTRATAGPAGPRAMTGTGSGGQARADGSIRAKGDANAAANAGSATHGKAVEESDDTRRTDDGDAIAIVASGAK